MASTLGFTYNELIAELQTTAEDTSAEFVAEMPTIVSAGETRLYGDLNFEIFDRERTGVLTINVNEQPIKPATWQGTRSLWLTPVGGGALGYLWAFAVPDRTHLAGLYPHRHPGWPLCAHVWRLVRCVSRAASGLDGSLRRVGRYLAERSRGRSVQADVVGNRYFPS